MSTTAQHVAAFVNPNGPLCRSKSREWPAGRYSRNGRTAYVIPYADLKRLAARLDGVELIVIAVDPRSAQEIKIFLDGLHYRPEIRLVVNGQWASDRYQVYHKLGIEDDLRVIFTGSELSRELVCQGEMFLEEPDEDVPQWAVGH